MKKIFYKISWITAIASIAIVSCSKDFGTINQNPGGATSPIPSGLLTNVLSNLDNQVWNGGGISTIGGLYCQYYSETQYTEASRYAKQFPDWDGFYAGDMYDLQNIINYNSDPATADIAAQYGSNNNQVAIARILKAYYYWFLTDNYGDLPYSEALKADNGLAAFDSQQSVYADLFSELTAAVAQFDDGLPVKGDILFGGDNTMWKKFANSIRALMALQISKADAAKGKSEFAAALAADGGVFEAGEGAKLSYPDANFPNPVYNYYAVVQRRDYAISETLTGYLGALADPRVTVFGTSDVGFPYGLTRDDAIAFFNAHTDWARLLQGDATPVTKPFYIISSSEIYLARAEAAFRGWTTESVADMYETGISENWKQWGIFDQAAFDIYMQGPNVALGTEADEELICIQEWVSHFPNGSQGWATWRRTGFPTLDPAPDQALAIPRRFAYGLNNYNLNNANTKAAAAQYDVAGDADSQLGKVWWDK